MGKLVAASSLIVLVFLVGCGGDSSMGSVTGTVTLDGQPLPDAFVRFSGKKGGSPAMGHTDASGNYTLLRTREASGADIGEHAVAISTFQAGDPDSDPPVAASPEKVPAKYNVDTELKATVTDGKNVVNFDLKSDGKILQPDKTERAAPGDSAC